MRGDKMEDRPQQKGEPDDRKIGIVDRLDDRQPRPCLGIIGGALMFFEGHGSGEGARHGAAVGPDSGNLSPVEIDVQEAGKDDGGEDDCGESGHGPYLGHLRARCEAAPIIDTGSGRGRTAASEESGLRCLFGPKSGTSPDDVPPGEITDDLTALARDHGEMTDVHCRETRRDVLQMFVGIG